ncbi:MAG TPA: ECF-type sigma factor [Thermoanaerobaculia bacterium]|jgi:RNA polymerase sigma factor (TIGR02999 family)|nr:ECF-type sigma factor [Thermoanaerobaculia bacterium]
MSKSSPEGITLLLRRCRAGSHEAEQELWPVLYRELKILARSVLRGRGGRPRLGATTLVHEAYLRLLGPAASSLEWNDRSHFFAVAARAMRFVLVDEARRRLAGKRDGVDTRAEIPEDCRDPKDRAPDELLAVHQALERLEKVHPRYEKLVEMRYFAGLSVDETAEALGVSRPTVVRDWQAARTWLYGELNS